MFDSSTNPNEKAIETYAVGNGEITLTTDDAEELRMILQTEYLRKYIEGVIEDHKELFHFNKNVSRTRFVDEMVGTLNDMVNYDSIYYEETITSNMCNKADELGI